MSIAGYWYTSYYNIPYIRTLSLNNLNNYGTTHRSVIDTYVHVIYMH